MNKLLIVWIIALILLLVVIFIPIPTSMESSNSNNTNSIVVGVIGNPTFILSNSSLTLKTVPSVNYSLNDYSIIILEQTYCDYGLRFALANWVRNGGKLIVIENACTQVPNDPTTIGWNVGVNSLGTVMPATYGGLTISSNSLNNSQYQVNVDNGSFEIIDYSSFAFNNFSNSNFSGNATMVNPSADGKILSLITFENNSENQSIYAMIKSSKYNVFYLSFDPSLEEKIINNIIQGLTG